MLAAPTFEAFQPANIAPETLSVIVVSYNTVGMLGQFFEALKAALGEIDSRVIVVDNNSRDDSVEFIRKQYPIAQLIVNAKNIGFGRANNQAVGLVRGRYVLLLNSDAFIEPDSLEKSIAYMDSHPRCGISGVRLIGRDGALQPSCRYFPTPWNSFLVRTGLSKYIPKARLVDDMNWDHAAVRSCDWVPGCFYLVRREVIDQIGLFDPRYFLYFEEVDHCLAAKKAGWEVHYYPGTTVIHIGGESAKSEGDLTGAGRQISALQVESELLYFRKNYGILGVLASVFLSLFADLILMVKRILKRRPQGLVSHIKHSLAVLSLFARTSCGSRPTR